MTLALGIGWVLLAISLTIVALIVPRYFRTHGEVIHYTHRGIQIAGSNIPGTQDAVEALVEALEAVLSPKTIQKRLATACLIRVPYHRCIQTKKFPTGYYWQLTGPMDEDAPAPADAKLAGTLIHKCLGAVEKINRWPFPSLYAVYVLETRAHDTPKTRTLSLGIGPAKLLGETCFFEQMLELFQEDCEKAGVRAQFVIDLARHRHTTKAARLLFKEAAPN